MFQVNLDKKLLKENRPINMMEEDLSSYHARLKASSSLQYSLLMENLDRIEDVFAGTDLVRLQRDILVHIRRLGALKLFHACLSRTLIAPTADNSNSLHSEHSGGCSLEFPLGEQKHNEIVHSGKKKDRKLRRIRAFERASEMSAMLGSSKKNCKTFSLPTGLGKLNNSSESRKRRVLIAKNESEMSRGVKVIFILHGFEYLLFAVFEEELINQFNCKCIGSCKPRKNPHKTGRGNWEASQLCQVGRSSWD